jgi:hypothetical protein
MMDKVQKLSYSNEYQDYSLLECDAMYFGRWQPVLYRNLLVTEAAGSSETLVPRFIAPWDAH